MKALWFDYGIYSVFYLLFFQTFILVLIKTKSGLELSQFESGKMNVRDVSGLSPVSGNPYPISMPPIPVAFHPDGILMRSLWFYNGDPRGRRRSGRSACAGEREAYQGCKQNDDAGCF